MRAAIAVALTAITTGFAPQQPFRAGVDLVHFSVIVSDKQGAPITGLTADDFELVEEGKARPSPTSPRALPSAAISAVSCRRTWVSRSTPAAAWSPTSTMSGPA